MVKLAENSLQWAKLSQIYRPVKRFIITNDQMMTK
jgi:hypothetical protein